MLLMVSQRVIMKATLYLGIYLDQGYVRGLLNPFLFGEDNAFRDNTWNPLDQAMLENSRNVALNHFDYDGLLSSMHSCN